MAKRGRKKIPLHKDVKKRRAYYRKRYRDMKKNTPDYQDKTHLRVRATKIVPKTGREVNKFPKKARARLHRYNYISLPGVIEIPESDLGKDEDVVNYLRFELPPGEYVISGGGAHRSSKRCTWRWLWKIRIIDMGLNPPKGQVLAVDNRKLRYYWFRKKD